MRISGSIVATVAALSSSVTLLPRAAEPLWFYKAQVSDGPLLVLNRWGDDHRQGIWVVDPEAGPRARRFLATRGNLVVVHRVDRGRLIVYSYPSNQDAPEGYRLHAYLEAKGEVSLPEQIRGKPYGYYQWVDVDVMTGRRTREEIQGKIWPDLGGNGPGHYVPGPPPATRAEDVRLEEARSRYFLEDWGQLSFRGDEQLLANYRTPEGGVFNKEIYISREGEWAAFRTRDGMSFLADGRRKIVTGVLDGWVSHRWLPRLGPDRFVELEKPATSLILRR